MMHLVLGSGPGDHQTFDIYQHAFGAQCANVDAQQERTPLSHRLLPSC
jgi:hypothetical protein